MPAYCSSPRFTGSLPVTAQPLGGLEEFHRVCFAITVAERQNLTAILCPSLSAACRPGDDCLTASSVWGAPRGALIVSSGGERVGEGTGEVKTKKVRSEGQHRVLQPDDSSKEQCWVDRVRSKLPGTSAWLRREVMRRAAKQLTKTSCGRKLGCSEHDGSGFHMTDVGRHENCRWGQGAGARGKGEGESCAWRAKSTGAADRGVSGLSNSSGSISRNPTFVLGHPHSRPGKTTARSSGMCCRRAGRWAQDAGLQVHLGKVQQQQQQQLAHWSSDIQGR